MAEFVKPLDEHIDIRTLRLIPVSTDLTVVILKGHLVVEEMLRRILQLNVRDSSALDDTRLSFFQVLRLVQAFTAHLGDASLWQELEQLNRLRNTLAHQIEPVDLETKLNAFLVNFITEPLSVTTMSIEEKALFLGNKITFLCGRLKFILERSSGGEGDSLIRNCPL